MQRSEISLPGDWPHLQTTCFALRHCRKTHLDTQKTLIKPNCQPRSPWTIQTQTLEHTWTYIPQVFSSFFLFRVEVVQWNLKVRSLQPPGHCGMFMWTFLHQGGTQEHSALTNSSRKHFRLRSIKCYAQRWWWWWSKSSEWMMGSIWKYQIQRFRKHSNRVCSDLHLIGDLLTLLCNAWWWHDLEIGEFKQVPHTSFNMGIGLCRIEGSFRIIQNKWINKKRNNIV